MLVKYYANQKLAPFAVLKTLESQVKLIWIFYITSELAEVPTSPLGVPMCLVFFRAKTTWIKARILSAQSGEKDGANYETQRAVASWRGENEVAVVFKRFDDEEINRTWSLIASRNAKW